MKKIILIAFTALFACAVMNAQDHNRMYFGPKLGLNITTITNTDYNSWRAGVNVGAFALYHYNEYIGAQAELLYSMGGANYGNGNNIKTGYIAIPILAKIYLYDRLALNLGPQFGFRVYDKIGTPSDFDYKDDNAFNVFDLQFQLGLSYEFNFGLMADFRYGIGLTNAIKSSYNGGNNKNQMFQLSVGWMF